MDAALVRECILRYVLTSDAIFYLSVRNGRCEPDLIVVAGIKSNRHSTRTGSIFTCASRALVGTAKTLGGEVTAQSELGKGSTFIVTIATGNMEGVALIDPCPHTMHSELVGEPLPEIRLNCCILIVDDRREIRYLSKHFLSQAGATTREAEDGEQAIGIVTELMSQGSLFALILLDMQMPRLDGYATATHLRALGYIGPIIALTADAMQGDMSRCLESGCDDYLSKPIDKQKLLEKVVYFLGKRHKRQG